jgi:hypothetical protein
MVFLLWRLGSVPSEHSERMELGRMHRYPTGRRPWGSLCCWGCSEVKDRICLWKEGVRDLVMEICCVVHNFRVHLLTW